MSAKDAEVTLKPCPACGGAASVKTGSTGSRFVACLRYGCQIFGPQFDPAGAKWNAIPRRDDAAYRAGQIAGLEEAHRYVNSYNEMDDEAIDARIRELKGET